jgi:hypothetical protein
MVRRTRPGISRFRVRCHRAARCADPLASPRNDGVWVASFRNDVNLKSTNDFALATQRARAIHKFFRPKRAQGTPGARCTRSPLCKGRKHRGRSHRYPGTPGISLRNGFNGVCRALPGDRALLPPSPRGLRFCHCPVGPIKPPQDLTPASGRQDHTILPSATSSLVRVLLIAHRSFDPPCNPVARSTLPRPPHPAPNVRDDHDTPLLWDGMARVIDVIWGA